MTRKLSFLQALAMLLLVFACASSGEQPEAESEPIEFAATDPAEVERQREVSLQADIDFPPGALLDEWERNHGPVERLGPTDSTARFWDDQPGGEDEDTIRVDKAVGSRWTALTGWAVRGDLETDSNGDEHWYPADTDLSTMTDAWGEILNRCGRSGTQADYSWQPCILPWAKDPPVGAKIRKWMFRDSSCPAAGNQRTIFREGVKRAFKAVNTSAQDWIFNETTVEDADTWVVQCATPAEVATMPSSIGRGHGFGPLVQSHVRVAPFTLAIEGCEPEGATQAYWFNHDVVYTYKKGLVTVNWDLFWTFANACTSVTSTLYTVVRTFILHELGHIFGFSHFIDTTQFSNIMQTNPHCSIASGGFLYRPNMNESLNNYSMPVTAGLPLQTFDHDISCYKPGTQPTQ